MATFPPNQLTPRAVLDRFAKALMDGRLLATFGYEKPKPWERAAASGALRLRAAAVRLLPPRKEPLYARQRRSIRSYPRGYDVAKLGPFPGEPAFAEPTGPLPGHRHQSRSAQRERPAVCSTSVACLGWADGRCAA